VELGHLAQKHRKNRQRTVVSYYDPQGSIKPIRQFSNRCG
jgi:hypothetical protein